MDKNLTTEAYNESLNLLRDISTIKGFIASKEDRFNYKRIWARDGVIAGLATLMSNEKDLINTFEKTLITLKKYQHRTGRIASNITYDGKKISYGTTVGRIDTTLWYVIGVCQLALKTKNKKLFKKFEKSVEMAIFYLECIELNDRGLIYVPRGGDWADEYINHGYVLFDEILYLVALKSYAKALKLIGKKNEYPNKKASHLKKLIRVNYIPEKKNKASKHVYNGLIFNESLKVKRKHFPISYITNHSVSARIDNFANGLLLMTGILDKKESRALQKEIIKKFIDSKHSIIPAFYPVIKRKDEHWTELKANFLYQLKNNPHEFHNGGRWPLIHGFFLATLDNAGGQLYKFAETLKQNKYTFHEYYRGDNNKPKGTKYLSFSAASYIIAYQSITKNKKLFI